MARRCIKAARIDLIRIDDVQEPGDMDAIFPDMSADAENPKSYNFAPTDRLVASIKSGRRGAADFGSDEARAPAPSPPADLDKWAQIARHVVLHYNRGVGQGISLRHPLLGDLERAGLQAVLERFTGRVLRACTTRRRVPSRRPMPAALVGGPAISKPLIAGALSRRNLSTSCA